MLRLRGGAAPEISSIVDDCDDGRSARDRDDLFKSPLLERMRYLFEHQTDHADHTPPSFAVQVVLLVGESGSVMPV